MNCGSPTLILKWIPLTNLNIFHPTSIYPFDSSPSGELENAIAGIRVNHIPQAGFSWRLDLLNAPLIKRRE